MARQNVTISIDAQLVADMRGQKLRGISKICETALQSAIKPRPFAIGPKAVAIFMGQLLDENCSQQRRKALADCIISAMQERTTKSDCESLSTYWDFS